MKPSPEWDNYRIEMQKHIDKGDFRHPWQWPTVVATMYVGRGEVVKRELQEIRKAGVVSACSWSVDDDCANLIHQRYQLMQWELANPEKKISDLKTIVEVGAGYGAMIILLSRLGFRGKYYIVDLPELEIVQRQHLAFRGIKCRLKWGEKVRPDLLIGIASLSEIPPKGRTVFLNRCKPKSYLIAYQPDWGKVDNRNYFKKWAMKYHVNGGPSFISFADPNQFDYLISAETPR